MKDQKTGLYCLWLLVDPKDPLKLPLFVADSSTELAKMIGLKDPAFICSSINKYERGLVKHTKYERVYITEEEWKWCHT